jgi:membrane associated rhomboid family serine protease
MGVYDRDYYRNDPPPAAGLLGGVAPVTKWLIAINVVVFVAQLLTLGSPGGGVTEWLMLSREAVVRHWEIWRLVTNAFCHAPGGPTHILFNMLGLWIFGNQIEPIYGQREFLRFYLTAAVLSSLGYLGLQALLGSSNPMYGASGAVMGVMMVCAMYYPSMRISLFVITLELRWLVVLYVIYDTFPILLQLGGGRDFSNVAHAAHLSGLVYGFLYMRYDLRYSRLLGGWNWQHARRRFANTMTRKSERVRLYEPPEEPVAPADLSRRVDDILAKITAHGEPSLTDEEREILKEASRRYKKR